ncbi:MAG: cobalamin-dependent protein [Peptococcaceae bacterium]|nr:cobalamin-dependent protein [Peptococcaceae bacterium]
MSVIIEQGRRDEAAAKVQDLLQHHSPLDIINREFIPALNRVGQRFAAGELFLPQLLMSAQAVQNGFAVINDAMQAFPAESSPHEQPCSKGKILLATVLGDIHDIGKNIVSMLLKSFGYDIVDLGKDVPPEAVVEAIRTHDIRLIGLSALMTTTLKNMRETIEAIRAAELPCVIMVGGAVLNEDYTRFVGADYYAKDAMAGVEIANRFFGR